MAAPEACPTLPRRRGAARHGVASVVLDFQLATAAADVPPQSFFEACAARAVGAVRRRGELTIRVVGAKEGRALNRRWRNIDRATNVLSFPVQGLEAIAPDLLGDVVICAAVVTAEADAQGKTHAAHWAHLTVHGVLHLLGFDHDEAAAAELMEEQERAILSGLGYPDPYIAPFDR